MYYRRSIDGIILNLLRAAASEIDFSSITYNSLKFLVVKWCSENAANFIFFLKYHLKQETVIVCKLQI